MTDDLREEIEEAGAIMIEKMHSLLSERILELESANTSLQESYEEQLRRGHDLAESLPRMVDTVPWANMVNRSAMENKITQLQCRITRQDELLNRLAETMRDVIRAGDITSYDEAYLEAALAAYEAYRKDSAND